MTLTTRKAHSAQTCRPTPEQLGEWAFTALIDEALLTPKPGLVDLRRAHAHTDMSLGLMCRSAHALKPWFVAMAQSMVQHQGLHAQRATLGELGRLAEAAMMDATDGVNTHRGAIWAIGLLVAGVALATMNEAYTSHSMATRVSPQTAPGPQRHTSPVNAVIAQAALLARCHDPYAPRTTNNKGAMACRRYQVSGAKGQARAGFPHVVRIGLPALHQGRQRGLDEHHARLDTLLALIATLEDTCLLSRGGLRGLADLQTGARLVLHLGGCSAPTGRAALTALNTLAREQQLSPGGAADLLAATLFLDQLATFCATARPVHHTTTQV